MANELTSESETSNSDLGTEPYQDAAFNSANTNETDEKDNKLVEDDSLPTDLKARETQLILDTLNQNGGHRQKTAEALNISPRTLRYKLAKLKEQGVDIQ